MLPMFQLERKYYEMKKDVLDVCWWDTYLKNSEWATNVITAMKKSTTLLFVKALLISTTTKITADENEEKVATLIGVKSDLLLQTADCIISNPGKWKALKLKVLLDPGSQRM